MLVFAVRMLCFLIPSVSILLNQQAAIPVSLIPLILFSFRTNTEIDLIVYCLTHIV